MQKSCYTFQETGLFGKLFCDFIAKAESLAPFVPQTHDNLNLKEFDISDSNRDTLVSVIEEQAKVSSLSDKSTFNLNTLKEKNTYTVTTGHQLNIVGGPLFFTYKILSTIKACEVLSDQYPEANFVPIYWAATEDHDYKEINHFHLFGKKLEWEKKVENIPVGDIPLNEIKDFVESWKDIPDEIKDCYLESETLKEAHIKLVYHLFGKYGILVLDANDKRLKESFVSVAVKEIEEQFIYKEVSQTNEHLIANGAKVQVKPRECNLFYLDGRKRFRIEVQGNDIVFIGADKRVTKSGFIEKIKSNPEVLSPNVMMRPLYQQQILPNVAYIGGPGEIAYWLQLKSMFAEAQVSYPTLIPRFFALYLPSYIQNKLVKAGLQEEDVFKSVEELKSRVLSNDSEGEELIKSLGELFSNYQSGVLNQLKSQNNQSLISYTESTFKRMEKDHSNVSKKVKKEIQARNSVVLGRIESIIDSLYPGGTPQERKESVFTFSANNESFIDELFRAIDPFDFKYNILTDGQEVT